MGAPRLLRGLRTRQAPRQHQRLRHRKYNSQCFRDQDANTAATKVLTIPPRGVTDTRCLMGGSSWPRSHLTPASPEQEAGHCIFITFPIAGSGRDTGQQKKGWCPPHREGVNIFCKQQTMDKCFFVVCFY